MAKDEKTNESKKKEEPGFFAKLSSRIARNFREIKSEMKKVVWPTRKQTVNNSLVAAVVIIASAIVLWGFDQLAYLCVQALISLGA